MQSLRDPVLERNLVVHSYGGWTLPVAASLTSSRRIVERIRPAAYREGPYACLA